MKRIEAVITPSALDAFKEAAPGLGISEFDIVQVYRSGCAVAKGPQQLYRGSEYTADLLRLRLEFMLFDDKVQTTLHQLLELVHPERIAVFKLDQQIRPASSTNGQLKPLFPPDHLGTRPIHPVRSDISSTTAKVTVTDRTRT
jgi:nitrogen regulatory protein PII